ncbi:chemotaxis protein CheW [Gilvimarinus sp. F26214L]|uniref:chemotaxis protein CheW n=1 Tax=Gilvimarinus sp. DZF01 TaxID=3461371 RepID=UPI004045F783
MTEAKKIENQSQADIASLLIPLVGRQLLVPTVTVAEMVPFQAPERNPESPDWYLGDVIWRQERIPVVSYEVMCGEAMPGYDRGSRIAVLNNVGVDPSLSFIGLATQGIPRLARVKAEEIHQSDDAQLKRFDLMHASHAGEILVIPDVQALQQAFIDYLQVR